MNSVETESPDESYFNDLSQQVPNSTANGNRHSPSGAENGDGAKDDAGNKLKRIACVLCRKRKLRCDGTRPTCGTCKRLSHDCAYDEVRKKSGPKRGYVKLLEARLQQVETLLKNQESAEKEAPATDPSSVYVASTLQQGMPMASDKNPVSFPGISPGQEPMLSSGSADSQTADADFSWEMIGLGLDEPLPPQDVQNDLYQIYFNKIHPSIPVIHKPRFFAAMNLGPHMRPPICLRYSMWTLAASVSDKYDALQEHFYQRARKYAQADEMRGHGEATISVAHCQTWNLLCTYEFKQMYFPRAWLSVGRAVRLAQMMQLHRMDGVGLDVKQCLPPPKDWTEREERRRTFWMSFCVDRYASIGTGWPMTIDERDILTNLPSSEEAFEKSKPMSTIPLDQALQPNGASKLEPFAGIAVTSALFGRNLLHLHRPCSDDRDDDLNGGFWTRHRDIENILLSTSLGLPDALRLPSGLSDPNIVFLNMSIHTSAICLHQAAIFKADKYRLPITVSNESKIRCVTAAQEIASVMRMISHMDLSSMNPFISFCVYVAARVFVQYLKTRPNDQQMTSSLQFLLQAMQALRRRNPLTESFLVQLDLDLEAAGIVGSEKWRMVSGLQDRLTSETQRMQHISDRTANPIDPINQKCPGIYEVSDSQANAMAASGINDFPTATNSVDQQPQNTEFTGPPFHRANATISLSLTPNPFVPSQANNNQIPFPDATTERQSNSDAYIANSVAFTISDEGNEMDVSTDDQPSPATSQSQSQSRGNSSSHTSHSPAGGAYQNDIHNLQFRNSPKNISSQTQQQQQPLTSSANPNSTFLSASEDIFSATMYSTGGDAGFLMGNEWDIGGMGAGNMGSSGMTPMSEGSWNQMLESINLGWDSVGPPPLNHGPHGHMNGAGR